MFIRCQLGEEGVKSYARLRHRELSRPTSRLRDTPWDNGYHDGSKRLSCVDDMHKLALRGCSPSGSILHLVSRVILDLMLQPKEVRHGMSAARIRTYWLEGLEKVEDDIGVGSREGVEGGRLLRDRATIGSTRHVKVMTTAHPRRHNSKTATLSKR